MTNIFQGHWFTMVRRSISGGLLEAQTIYRGTDSECAALLQVETNTLKITSATWEVYAPEIITKDIEGLTGVEAYFQCGPVLKTALAEMGDFARSLFAETVRGIIQAETFLLAERGFATPRDYSRYWEHMYSGSCRYYSHTDRVVTKWDEYACAQRTTNLFNRFKSQCVYQTPQKGYRVTGTLSDSFHELSITIALDPDLVIKEADGKLLRVPDDVCCESLQYLRHLPGWNAADQGKKTLARLLGAGEGCVHLIDVVYDATESVKKLFKGEW